MKYLAVFIVVCADARGDDVVIEAQGLQVRLDGVSGDALSEVKSVVEKVHESCISGSLGIDMVSQYIARGLPLEDQGAILRRGGLGIPRPVDGRLERADFAEAVRLQPAGGEAET